MFSRYVVHGELRNTRMPGKEPAKGGEGKRTTPKELEKAQDARTLRRGATPGTRGAAGQPGPLAVCSATLGGAPSQESWFPAPRPGSGPHTTRPADSRFSPSMDKCLATLRQHGVVGRNSWPVGCRVRGIAAAAPAPPMPRLQGHRAPQGGVLRVRVPQLQPLRWRQPPAPPGRADGAA